MYQVAKLKNNIKPSRLINSLLVRPVTAKRLLYLMYKNGTMAQACREKELEKELVNRKNGFKEIPNLVQRGKIRKSICFFFFLK